MFMTQGSVASATINQYNQALTPPAPTIDCCDPTVASSQCNRTWGLLPPLALTGHLANLYYRTLSIDEILFELESSHPVGIQIDWPGGGGHFVLVTGVWDFVFRYYPDPDRPDFSVEVSYKMLAIDDPAVGLVDYWYDDVVSAYDGDGVWSTSFTTGNCISVPDAMN